MTTLTEMIAEVRRLVVDTDEMRWPDSEVIRSALKWAQLAVWQEVASQVPKYQAVATKTPSSGVISLTSEAPLTIVRLTWLSGDSREPMRRISPFDVRVMASQIGQSFEVHYVPEVSFPAADVDDFSWGGLTDEHLLEYAMATRAALRLEAPDGAKPALLEEDKRALEAAVGQPTQASRGITPMPSVRRGDFAPAWVLHTQDIVHLVWSR